MGSDIPKVCQDHPLWQSISAAAVTQLYGGCRWGLHHVAGGSLGHGSGDVWVVEYEVLALKSHCRTDMLPCHLSHCTEEAQIFLPDGSVKAPWSKAEALANILQE